jgi:transcription initiation factor TFIIH subunit 2
VVICDYDHLKVELNKELAPPPVASVTGAVAKCLIQMGLPARITTATASLCACHATLTLTGYACPQCGAKHCQLPTCCAVCGLVLVSSQHLARSTRHLFPLPPYAPRVPVPELPVDEEQPPPACAACFSELGLAERRWQCPRCRSEYCDTCNAYMHDTLNNCPTCDATGAVDASAAGRA